MVGAIPGYALNRHWTWRQTGQSGMAPQMVRYWMVAFAGLAMSTAFVVVAASMWPDSTAVVSAANITAYGVLWIVKFTYFDRVLFRSPPAPATESAAGFVSGYRLGE